MRPPVRGPRSVAPACEHDPLRRRRRRPRRAARAAGAMLARAPRGARRRLRRRQRRERRGRASASRRSTPTSSSRPAPTSITLGNHTYRHREVWPYLEERREIVRPANFLADAARPRHCVVERDGVTPRRRQPRRQPLHAAGRARASRGRRRARARSRGADHVLVDMHAEATSEKVALGWYLDGRVTAVVGTHTHVPTADARVLPGGTAYITDVGMTGARGGVIGVRREQSIASMRTHMPQRFETAEEDPWLNAVLVRCADGAAGDGDRAAAPPAAAGRRAGRSAAAAGTRRCRGRTSASRRAGARSAPPRPAPPRVTSSRRRGHERDRDARAPPRRAARPSAAAGQVVEAPDRERRARARLEAERAVRRTCRAVADRDTGARRASAGRDRRREPRCAARPRPAVANSGASASGANFVRPGERGSAPRAAGRAAPGTPRARARRRARRWRSSRRAA